MKATQDSGEKEHQPQAHPAAQHVGDHAPTDATQTDSHSDDDANCFQNADKADADLPSGDVSGAQHDTAKCDNPRPLCERKRVATATASPDARRLGLSVGQHAGCWEKKLLTNLRHIL